MIKALISVLALFSVPFSFAQESIFTEEFGYTAQEEFSRISTSCGSPMDPQACGIEICKQGETDTVSGGYGTLKVYNSINVLSDTGDENGGSIQYQCIYDNTVYYNGHIDRQYQTTGGASATYTIGVTYKCPPDNWPNAQYKEKIGEADYCFDPVDLNFRDSCPDSSSDPNFVLPVGGNNTSASICVTQPDGSRCEYDQVGDVYVTDYENSCYTNAYPEFDPNGYNQADPESPNQCQDIGNGVSACIEDPVNVCPNGNCQTGCGNMSFDGGDPVFVCLSGDTDGDGIGDYVDPDVDGDGIPNEDDLDYDGDGIDDPTYENPSNQPVSVNVDSAAIGQAVGDKVREALIEQGDFSGTESTNAIQSDIDTLQSDTDTLLNDENFNLTGLIDSTGVESSLDPITANLQKKTCTNNIDIPFTGKQLDICSAADRAEPWLYIIFAFSTVLYVVRRVTDTVKES
jgi:hypothetical protein